jgi:hypothetical protein
MPWIVSYQPTNRQDVEGHGDRSSLKGPTVTVTHTTPAETMSPTDVTAGGMIFNDKGRGRLEEKKGWSQDLSIEGAKTPSINALNLDNFRVLEYVRF